MKYVGGKRRENKAQPTNARAKARHKVECFLNLASSIERKSMKVVCNYEFMNIFTLSQFINYVIDTRIIVCLKFHCFLICVSRSVVKKINIPTESIYTSFREHLTALTVNT